MDGTSVPAFCIFSRCCIWSYSAVDGGIGAVLFSEQKPSLTAQKVFILTNPMEMVWLLEPGLLFWGFWEVFFSLFYFCLYDTTTCFCAWDHSLQMLSDDFFVLLSFSERNMLRGRGGGLVRSRLQEKTQLEKIHIHPFLRRSTTYCPYIALPTFNIVSKVSKSFSHIHIYIYIYTYVTGL